MMNEPLKGHLEESGAKRWLERSMQAKMWRVLSFCLRLHKRELAHSLLLVYVRLCKSIYYFLPPPAPTTFCH